MRWKTSMSCNGRQKHDANISSNGQKIALIWEISKKKNFLDTTNQQPFVDNQISQFIFTILLLFLNLIILRYPIENVCFCISNPKYNSKIALQTSYTSIIKLHSWIQNVTIQKALKKISLSSMQKTHNFHNYSWNWSQKIMDYFISEIFFTEHFKSSVFT